MIKDEIREYAKTLGIEKLGFSKNSVVALFPYFVKGEEGNLSLYARSIDYHIIAEEKLKVLSKILTKNGAAKIEIQVDKGEYNDRRAAYEAGLGFYGMNGMLICQEYGSYFFIGQIIHDLLIDSDPICERDCLMCGRCERECPGKALSGGKVDEQKCLSQITQKRGELTSKEESLIKHAKLCWGCDVCQRVCPHNGGLETTAMQEFMGDRISHLALSDIEDLSNSEFKKRYGQYAFSWRGKGVLLRNLKILFSEGKSDEEK